MPEPCQNKVFSRLHQLTNEQHCHINVIGIVNIHFASLLTGIFNISLILKFLEMHENCKIFLISKISTEVGNRCILRRKLSRYLQACLILLLHCLLPSVSCRKIHNTVNSSCYGMLNEKMSKVGHS